MALKLGVKYKQEVARQNQDKEKMQTQSQRVKSSNSKRTRTDVRMASFNTIGTVCSCNRLERASTLCEMGLVAGLRQRGAER